MQLHQLKPKKKKRPKKRIGRGGKRGTYSGRGIKGQKARAGRRLRSSLRDFVKQIPKKRGYERKSTQEKPQVVNLDQLEKSFSSGQKITLLSLLEKQLIDDKKRVKILGRGILRKKLQIVLGKKVGISKSAKKKVKAVGGSIIES